MYEMAAGVRYTALTETAHKTPAQIATPLLHATQLLPSNGCFSGSTVLALREYATVFSLKCLIYDIYSE
jgi:hypothetical protein